MILNSNILANIFFQAHETSICLLCVVISEYLLKYYDNTVYNLVLLSQVMDYSFMFCLSLCRSAGCCVCGFETHVASREDANYATQTFMNQLKRVPPVSSFLFKKYLN